MGPVFCFYLLFGIASKILIFPRIHNLPLMGLGETGDDLIWTSKAEGAQIELLWDKPV